MTRLPSPLLALQFLTVLPLRCGSVVTAPEVARAQLWYPSAGLVVGLAVAGLDRLLSGRLPAAPEAALVLIALEGLTGFLHLDGLADSADGLLGLHSRERRLEIMRDSRIGTFGVAAVVLYLLLAFAAITALAQPARTAVLIATPALARGAMVAVGGAFAYARTDGLATGFHEAARSWIGIAAMLTALAIAEFALGFGGIVLLIASASVALAFAAFGARRLGGVTGDVIGASCELAQVTCLTLATALQSHAWFLPWR